MTTRSGRGAARIAAVMQAKPSETARANLFARARQLPFWPWLGRFALFTTVFSLPWPGLGIAYTQLFASAAEGVASLLESGSTLDVRFDPAVASDLASSTRRAAWLVLMRVYQRAPAFQFRVPLDSRFCYLQMSVFLALALATNVHGARRRAIVFGGGVSLMLLITAASSLAVVVAQLELNGALALGAASHAIVSVLYKSLVAPGMTFALPALVFWVLISSTKSHLKSEKVTS